MKKLLIITIVSIIACLLHAIILNTEYNNYLFTSAFKVLIFLSFPFMCLKLIKNGSFLKLIKITNNRKTVKPLFILGFGVFTVIIVAFIFLRSYIERGMIVAAMEQYSITSGNFIFVFIYIVLINAMLEEVFFRGFVFLTLYKQGYKKYAYIFSSVLFSLYHIAILKGAFSPAMFIFCIIGLVAAGFIFNKLASLNNNIFGSLVVHISANFALNMIVVYYLYFYEGI